MADSWQIEPIDGGTKITPLPEVIDQPVRKERETPGAIVKRAFAASRVLHGSSDVEYIKSDKHVCDMAILTGHQAPNNMAFLQRQCSGCGKKTTFDMLPTEQARQVFIKLKASGNL